MWPIWNKECSSIYKFCTDRKTVKSHLQIIENVIDEKNIVEINLECLRLEYDEVKKDSKIEKVLLSIFWNKTKILLKKMKD